MDVKSNKSQVINDIATLKSSCQIFPNLKLTNSIPSLNNSFDTISFLMDLIKTISGAEKLKDEIINIMSYELDVFELKIKKILKKLIKQSYSCGTNPTTPDYLIDGYGVGINIDIQRFDFFDILRIDPLSPEGNVIYGDPSVDFNRFLYETIQSGPNTWNNILKVEYIPIGSLVDGEIKNNVLNIKISSYYKNKSLYVFLNDFIDSIRILPTDTSFSILIDSIYGSISSKAKKTEFSVRKEIEIETIIKKILNLDDTNDSLINSSYVEFNNDDLIEIDFKSNERINGYKILKDCEFTPASPSFETINDIVTEIRSATTISYKYDVIKSGLIKLSKEASINSSDIDRHSSELDFFNNLLKGLIIFLIKSIIGPALILTLSLFIFISNGSLGFTNMIDFISKNFKFFIDMVREVMVQTIQKYLLKILIVALKELVLCNLLENEKQMRKQYTLSLRSLVNSNVQNNLDLLTEINTLLGGI